MAVKTKSSRKGLFITFEGIDGCGKSTQMSLTTRFLEKLGYSVTPLREPGSTRAAEKIREILLDRKSTMDNITELLLYEAARADVTREKIIPSLDNGRIVLSDRFYDSTTAYQGYGRKLDVAMVRKLHAIAVGSLKPDMTFLFDIPVESSFKRRGKTLDRLESQSKAFFMRVRKGFLEIAKKEPRRIKVLDASRSIEEIFVDVSKHLSRLLAR